MYVNWKVSINAYRYLYGKDRILYESIDVYFPVERLKWMSMSKYAKTNAWFKQINHLESTMTGKAFMKFTDAALNGVDA